MNSSGGTFKSSVFSVSEVSDALIVSGSQSPSLRFVMMEAVNLSASCLVFGGACILSMSILNLVLVGKVKSPNRTTSLSFAQEFTPPVCVVRV